MDGLKKIILKTSLLLFLCLTFTYSFPKVGDTPEDFTRYHFQLNKEWNLYQHMDGNTVILLITGSFT